MKIIFILEEKVEIFHVSTNLSESTNVFDLPEDYYSTFLANIEKVTKEDVKQAAQKYFMTNNTRVFVTGKGSEILKGLENIQYNGENLAVRYFDKFGNETERPDYSVDDTLTAGSIIDNYILEATLQTVEHLKFGFSPQYVSSYYHVQRSKLYKNNNYR